MGGVKRERETKISEAWLKEHYPAGLPSATEEAYLAQLLSAQQAQPVPEKDKKQSGKKN